MLSTTKKIKACITVSTLAAFTLNGCASLFPGVVEVAPNTYVIGDDHDDSSDAFLRAERITEATAYCTGKRSSMVILPNQTNDKNTTAPSTAEVRFQCIYFPNDSE